MISVTRPAGVEALSPFVDAGVLGTTEIEVVTTLARAADETVPDVLLAAGLAVRGPLLGHVCVDLASVADTVVVERADPDIQPDLAWPALPEWLAALRSSALVAEPDDVRPGNVVARPLVLDGHRLYLHRYWRYEQALVAAIVDRGGEAAGVAGPPDAPDESGAGAVLDRLFGPSEPGRVDRQRLAVESSLTRRLTVIAGGPGTGKTRTVARLLAVHEELALDAGRPLDIRLVAPTGKAASRMTEAVVAQVAAVDLPAEVRDRLLATEAVTLHRLLGSDGRGGFRHHADDRLPADVVVVDETSMVSLPMMARLFDAVRPDARVVLVGDPSQLASVEAGAVLGDLVGPVGPVGDGGDVDQLRASPLVGHAGVGLVVLDRAHRFDAGSPIARLAEHIRIGDADATIDLLRAGGTELRWVDPDDPVAVHRVHDQVLDHARRVVADARGGRDDLALDRLRRLVLLSATRYGPSGVTTLNRLVEHRLADAGVDVGARWYPGRPIIVTANDYLNQVSNGDIGVTVMGDRPQVVFPVGDGVRRLDPARLDRVETWWAMTIHKSQGSEFGQVVIALPPPPSPILTRELVYTAVTRATEQVTLVASEASIRSALGRPVSRASGLADQLRRTGAVTATAPEPLAPEPAEPPEPGTTAPEPADATDLAGRPADRARPDDPQLSLF